MCPFFAYSIRDLSKEPIHPLDLAYLSGGSSTAVYAAILSLVQRNVLAFKGVGFLHVARPVDDLTVHPLEFVIYKAVAGAPENAPIFRYGAGHIDAEIQKMNNRLQSAGLVMSRGAYILYRLLPPVFVFSAIACGALPAYEHIAHFGGTLLMALLLSCSAYMLMYAVDANGRTPAADLLVAQYRATWAHLIRKYQEQRTALSPEEVMIVAALLKKAYPQLPSGFPRIERL